MTGPAPIFEGGRLLALVDVQRALSSLAIGEVMVELSKGADSRFTVGCGGDTFNTAIYLARAGYDPRAGVALWPSSFSRSCPPQIGMTQSLRICNSSLAIFMAS